MRAVTENEDWIVERGGVVVDKKVRFGLSSLNDWEHLVYCLWVADYMMRNAGDLANAKDMYPSFQTETTTRARTLGLKLTAETFSLSAQQLQDEYFDRFEGLCNEIKSAKSAG
jgi:hypothetical protein